MNLGEGDDQTVEFSPALAVPRRVLLADEPAGLVLEPVQGAGKNCPPFIPYQLLVVEEADPQQAI